MFERLQKKWKVGGAQLLLILCTFAIGGSVTGYASRKLMTLLPIDQGWLWIVLYILFITLIWPLAVLIISIPFGQFRFFRAYIQKIGRRMGVSKSAVGSQQLAVDSRQSVMEQKSMDKVQPDTSHLTLDTQNIAIFASGAGSNAQKIIEHFKDSSYVKISLIVCNKPGAGVLQIAERENIPVLLINKETFFQGDAYINELRKYQIDFIVLAGFLWKMPEKLIKAWPGKIVNIHPALLPNYGGKGMYGNKVHEAVIAAGEKQSGISIHYVDEQYDHGDTIFQARCEVLENDSPDSLAQRIHQLEHEHYPRVISELLERKGK